VKVVGRLSSSMSDGLRIDAAEVVEVHKEDIKDENCGGEGA
jgi:hypothetical protein